MELLTGVFLIAVFMDLRRYRIPNACIAAGSLAGLILTYESCSAAGVLSAICRAAVIFAALYPFYLIKGLGAGDVKLLMMTAFYLQEAQLFSYILVTLLLAGGAAAVKLACVRESRGRLLYLLQYIRKAAVTGILDPYETDNTRLANVIRVSVPAFVSLLLLRAGLYG
ncbi:MAG: prepilin peptidase [Roseburia sp.]|nr:prepilin peptidase [Roseburia sp.]